jgi:prolyl-tRNA editing enzyme YbaK/EbsC (Cys-tRNA(Pro) deacylase)
MTDAIDRFVAASTDLGRIPRVRQFPQGTKTAADAADAIGCGVGQIVKSLIFMADDRPVLALTSGVNRVDERKLALATGAHEVRRATPEEARAATGFAVGGTPPFGYPPDLATYLDPHLQRFDEIWAAAGTPDSVFPLSPGELLRLSGAEIADITLDLS